MDEMAGGRFSQIYIAKGEPTEDSERMRRRLHALFREHRFEDNVEGRHIELITGAAVPKYHGGTTNWHQFFASGELRDLLDAITVIATVVGRTYERSALQWLHGCRTIMREENVRYRIDDKGIVHFAIDGQFTHDQACVIGALSDPRFGAARAHYEAGQRALDSSPPQTREAIRQTFDCVEAIFKLMFDVPRLGDTEIQKSLQPMIAAWAAGSERNAALRMVEAFRDWTNGAHQYRHAQAGTEPDNPSVQTAVLSITLGSGFARWLAELYSASEESKGKNQTTV